LVIIDEVFDQTTGEELFWKELELPHRNCGPDNELLPTDPEIAPWLLEIPGPMLKYIEKTAH
jgi:hypothetical protein